MTSVATALGSFLVASGTLLASPAHRLIWAAAWDQEGAPCRERVPPGSSKSGSEDSAAGKCGTKMAFEAQSPDNGTCYMNRRLRLEPQLGQSVFDALVDAVTRSLQGPQPDLA